MKIVNASYRIEVPPVGALEYIERAGRTCYKSEDRISLGSSVAFAAMVIQRGHESVLEHSVMSVRFIIDRGVSHELVRHRLAAFSQESTRYCNYGKGGEVTFIRPCFWASFADGIHVNEPFYSAWVDSMKVAEDCYLFMLREGASPQEARSVLPNSLKTEIVMTANLREWRHVFKLRTSKSAHPQMREVMVPLLAEVRTLVPVLFDGIV